jgi:hypothetical protein
MNSRFKIAITLTLFGSLTSGCDDRATRIAREAADRQAQQNSAMAELNKEVAAGGHQLVEADAQARKDIVSVHQDLQAERTRLDGGWSSLEKERQRIASERRTESLLAPLMSSAGAIVIVAGLLGFCWYAIVASRTSGDGNADLNEILVCEILARDQSLLVTDETGNSSSSVLTSRP